MNDVKGVSRRKNRKEAEWVSLWVILLSYLKARHEASSSVVFLWSITSYNSLCVLPFKRPTEFWTECEEMTRMQEDTLGQRIPGMTCLEAQELLPFKYDVCHGFSVYSCLFVQILQSDHRMLLNKIARRVWPKEGQIRKRSIFGDRKLVTCQLLCYSSVIWDLNSLVILLRRMKVGGTEVDMTVLVCSYHVRMEIHPKTVCLGSTLCIWFLFVRIVVVVVVWPLNFDKHDECHCLRWSWDGNSG